MELHQHQLGRVFSYIDPRDDVYRNAREIVKLPPFGVKNGAPDQPQIDDWSIADTTVTLPLPGLGGPQIQLPKNEAPMGKYARFVPVALAFAAMSKLPGTKVGCVILGKAYQVLSSGWNGAPRRSNADQDERLVDRETRLDWVVHAEANAIANAARSGMTLDGSTLICTLMPCMTCAKLIVQAGIERVLCPAPTEDNARWGREFDLTRRLFAECGIVLHHYDTTGEQA